MKYVILCCRQSINLSADHHTVNVYFDLHFHCKSAKEAKEIAAFLKRDCASGVTPLRITTPDGTIIKEIE